MHGGPGSSLNILLRRCNLLPIISNVRLPTPTTIKLNRNTAKHRFHVIANHSPGIQKIGNQLDYLGIVVLMWDLPFLAYTMASIVIQSFSRFTGLM